MSSPEAALALMATLLAHSLTFAFPVARPLGYGKPFSVAALGLALGGTGSHAVGSDGGLEASDEGESETEDFTPDVTDGSSPRHHVVIELSLLNGSAFTVGAHQLSTLGTVADVIRFHMPRFQGRELHFVRGLEPVGLHQRLGTLSGESRPSFSLVASNITLLPHHALRPMRVGEDCFFMAVERALQGLPGYISLTRRSLNARRAAGVIAADNRDALLPLWDGNLPSGSPAVDWAAFVDESRQPGASVSAPFIEATARALDIAILVDAGTGSFIRFGGQSGWAWFIGLRLREGHFDPYVFLGLFPWDAPHAVEFDLATHGALRGNGCGMRWPCVCDADPLRRLVARTEATAANAGASDP